MKKKRSVSLAAVTLGYLALIAGGFGVALLVLRTTNLPEKLALVTKKPTEVEIKRVDATMNDALKAELAVESTILDSKREELRKKLDTVEDREAEVSSLEVKSREGELDFSRLMKESDFNFLKQTLDSNKHLLEGIGELRSELDEMRVLINSILLVKSKLSSAEQIYRAKVDEFNQALNQRLSPTKEIFLYLLTLKFIWGLFTGYARSHYPYAQRDMALAAKERFERESRSLKAELSDLRLSLEEKTRSLEGVVTKVIDSVVASERPVLLTNFRVNFLKPLREFVASLDHTREEQRQLAQFRDRVDSLRRDGASFSPQFTPGAYVKTVGQAFFKLEEQEFKDKEASLNSKLSYLEDQGIVRLVDSLTVFLNDVEMKINHFGFLSRLAGDVSKS